MSLIILEEGLSMDIKILSSLTETDVGCSALVIGTHNGIFHSDEVVACATLCLLNSDKSVQILRSRDSEMLKKCDICVDVGGGKFDHHQPDFNKARASTVLYASAGLVWNHYGKDLIKQLLAKYFPENNSDIVVNTVFKAFDESYIALVDCEDNGIATAPHIFSFIASFLPLWFENSTAKFNHQFAKALEVTTEVLEQALKTTIGKEISRSIIEANWANPSSFNFGILKIPAQTIDWLTPVTSINSREEDKSHQIDFVIFPYPNGGWAAQCVPMSVDEKFSKRVPFPASWAGETENLPEICGIPGATFCHNGRFFIRGESFDTVFEMCKLAKQEIQS